MLFFSVKGCVITFLCIIFTFYLFVELLNYFLNCVKILIHCVFFYINIRPSVNKREND